MRKIACLILRGYQLFVSPLLGSHCRYYPSCSQYALDAIDGHGAVRGSWLAVRRLLRCHPWHPGGFDPVPGPHINTAAAGSTEPSPASCADHSHHFPTQPSSANHHG